MKVLLMSCLLLARPVVAQIASVSLGSAYRYNQGYSAKWVLGDTPNPTWADNGNIYLSLDDSISGWQGATSGGRDILFSTITGYTSAATGSLVNSMDAFGTVTQTGSDSKAFKSSGLISVGGTLYMITNRQPATLPGATGSCPNGVGFTKSDAQLIKSTDHGATWTPQPPSTANPYVSPMFPGSTFPAPWPVQYGEDYACDGRDNCSTYVYWLSEPNYQSEADDMYLARVSKANLPNLSASDWQFYQGGDGMLDANWGALGTAASVMHATCQIGESGAQWIPAANRYLMVQFYYPNIDSTVANTYWQFWQSAHPWGPWTTVGSPINWNPQGYYMASIVPSSVSSNTFTIFTAGNFTSLDPATGLYTLTMIPATLTIDTPGTVVEPGVEVTAGVQIQ